MMNSDIGAYVAALNAGRALGVVAGGAGDAVEANGPWVERPDGAMSVAVYALYRTTLASAETLSVVANIQDAADSGGTGAADFGTALASTVLETGVVTNAEGAVKIGDFNLSGARSHIRAQVTPDLSAGSIDTADLMFVFIFGGQDSLPA